MKAGLHVQTLTCNNISQMLPELQGKVDMAANMVAKEALMLHTCAHRGVVSLKFVGLTPPAMPDDTPDPCCVEYFGTPIADLSLDKLLG